MEARWIWGECRFFIYWVAFWVRVFITLSVRFFLCEIGGIVFEEGVGGLFEMICGEFGFGGVLGFFFVGVV